VSETPVLTLIVPTFNEADRLAHGLERLRGAAAEGAVDLDATELLLVDDGSSDDTRRTAGRLASQFPRARVVTFPRNLGKGAAVRAGILAATGDKVAFADADMAIDPSLLPSLLEALERVPVAVGSRAVHGHVDYGTRLRTDAGRAFNLAVRAIGGVHLADTQCGFKGFRRGPGLLLALLQTTQRYAFDVELLWLADRLGLEVEVVPVTWLDVPGSSVRVVRDSSRMLLDLVAARRRSRWVAALELDVTRPLEAAPIGTVVLRSSRSSLLCGEVGALGDLRRAARATERARLVSLDELVALAPFELEPAS
jgi:dolichyl-phosphate beta-glucosyltransferase